MSTAAADEDDDEPTEATAIRRRFRRSVHLERDFYRADGLDGYVVTAKARELVRRLAGALTAPEGERAWSITGPYGGGKSASALFAAHLARGSDAALARLDDADAALAAEAREAFAAPFCPVLIVGARRPLAEALLDGLAQSLSAFAEDTGADALAALADEADAAAPTDDEATRLYREAARTVHETTGGGLFVVIDELGKLLEYAALHPEQSDLYVLQRLSERAGDEQHQPPAPVALVTILHQAFERYAGRLPAAQREEWQKVQGRFEDFAFVEPADETLRLLAEAVDAQPRDEENEEAGSVDALLDAVRLPPHFDAEQVQRCLTEALPLSPAVSLAVGPLFRRLAQNERSLFAFLAAGEPHGFGDVMNRDDAPPRYRLDHLHDYLVGALGATLFDERMNRLWAETDAALARLEAPSALDERLLKQIAILGFAGDRAGLRPTAPLLRVAADAPPEEVDTALERLKEARVITYRPFHEEYHVWQGSDFDLEGKLAAARREVPERRPLAAMLREALPPLPLVARRHSYRTGATRVFEVIYASDETWRQHLEAPYDDADGRIIYVLPEHAGGARSALEETLRNASAQSDAPLTLLAVPGSAETLREAARDLACFDAVLDDPDLEGDAAARKEVREQRAELAGYVHDQLTRLISSSENGRNPCDWIYQGKEIEVESERALQQRLSRICDEVFSEAPEVWNELINRRSPSGSAVYGQKQLLEAILEHAEEPRLGIEGTPAAYGLYASVLRATGIHREQDRAGEDGTWTFGAPSAERDGCRAVWDAIGRLLDEAEGQRVAVADCYDTLTAPPYGVREGLLPVFLFAFYKHAEDEIAFYENGSFVHDPAYAEIERFLNAPEKFALQRVTVEEARADVLERLAPLVGLEETGEENRAPLPFVVRLLKSVRDLPPYTRKTGRLSDEALAVREALHRATEPATLLFQELPEACGLDSFLGDEASDDAEVFVTRLQDALRELGRAYGDLLDDIEERIAEAFALQAEDSEARRSELAERAQVLLSHVTDTALKSFCVRATDEMLDTQGWYESLAALLAKRPPEQWVDKDREKFEETLTQVAHRFRNQEPLYFEESKNGAGSSEAEGNGEDAVESKEASPAAQTNGTASPPKMRRIRLSISASDEPDQEAVVNIRLENEDDVDQVVKHVGRALEEADENNVDVKLAGVSEVAQSLLTEREASFSRSETA
ncbi:MAG: hypothetical protein BRD37_07275 [Bacteroidetes bacterium QH_8_67_23]|nr:MAG: hypothetical protein BRD37_07275 [Bacteroidetes bacterium QH_8_67_23]